ncbi:riboflavin synthase [Leifsonia sp. EB34]|uniref:riboflavin synthase n=1 Tax=Leifsonia sp. EB34 TaxID=3156303 RepID=UPI0035121EB5
MFTGIIEELGEVVAVERGADAMRITVRGPLAVSDAGHGDSISVSGVCLTVVDQDAETFTADVMAQTLEMSTLDDVAPGRRVNLERAAQVGDRLGGHIVQGHIDGTATVLSLEDGSAWRVVRLSLDPAHAPLVARKGSIAIDGVSLTVSDVGGGREDGWFEVSLIPETLAATTLGDRVPGDRVNIETDILARHVERMLALEPDLAARFSPETPIDTGSAAGTNTAAGTDTAAATQTLTERSAS